jgi:hypothetical protein
MRKVHLLYRVRQANFLFHMAFHIQKRMLACRTLYKRHGDTAPVCKKKLYKSYVWIFDFPICMNSTSMLKSEYCDLSTDDVMAYVAIQRWSTLGFRTNCWWLCHPSDSWFRVPPGIHDHIFVPRLLGRETRRTLVERNMVLSQWCVFSYDQPFLRKVIRLYLIYWPNR